MAVLNIRDIDSLLYAKVKSKAALEGKKIREVVIDQLEDYVSTEPGTEAGKDSLRTGKKE